jgi:hypothetical protein
MIVSRKDREDFEEGGLEMHRVDIQRSGCLTMNDIIPDQVGNDDNRKQHSLKNLRAFA